MKKGQKTTMLMRSKTVSQLKEVIASIQRDSTVESKERQSTADRHAELKNKIVHHLKADVTKMNDYHHHNHHEFHIGDARIEVSKGREKENGWTASIGRHGARGGFHVYMKRDDPHKALAQALIVHSKINNNV